MQKGMVEWFWILAWVYTQDQYHDKLAIIPKI